MTTNSSALNFFQGIGGTALLLSLAACTVNTDTGIAELIITERSGYVPEGIEYDKRNNRLLVGSMTDGTIYQVSNDGSLTPVVQDDALLASVGIEVDEEGNRLLVANSRFGEGDSEAMLGVYDLASGGQLAMIDLRAVIENPSAGANHFANDVAISPAGTAFITDTPVNIVYRVDKYFNADVLLDLGPDAGLALNGIEYHPAGYLILAAMGSEQLLKVPVNNPQNWSVVETDFSVTGADGLVWAEDGTLVVTSNNTSRVLKFHSEDNWRSAQLVGLASFPGQATTAAVAGDEVFVVRPNFTSSDAPVILRAKF